MWAATLIEFLITSAGQPNRERNVNEAADRIMMVLGGKYVALKSEEQRLILTEDCWNPFLNLVKNKSL